MSAQAGPRCRGTRTAFLRITTISTFFHDAVRCFGSPHTIFFLTLEKENIAGLTSYRTGIFSRLVLFFLTMFSFSSFSCIIAGVSRGKAPASHNHISLSC
jgi:hypothetical protein